MVAETPSSLQGLRGGGKMLGGGSSPAVLLQLGKGVVSASKNDKKSFPLAYANLCGMCLTSLGSRLVPVPQVYQLELPIL